MILKKYKLAFFILSVVLGVGAIQSNAVDAANSASAEAIFFVSWYNVGESALEGLDGVISVSNGWKDRKEINTVIYDPDRIDIDRMVSALKKAGTYLGIAGE
jgi:copper chaperone CopZ